MLRTVQLLPLAGLLTLGFDREGYPSRPPACYRASWQATRTGLAPAGDDELRVGIQSYLMG
jgi:hypothetical protein